MFLGFDNAHSLDECPTKKRKRLVELPFLKISAPSKNETKCTCKTTIKTVRPEFFDCPEKSEESGKKSKKSKENSGKNSKDQTGKNVNCHGGQCHFCHLPFQNFGMARTIDGPGMTFHPIKILQPIIQTWAAYSRLSM